MDDVGDMQPMPGSPIRPGESTADLCDRLGAQARVCHGPWHSYGGRPAASGRAACIRTFEDAGLVRQMLEQPGHGRILVVDGSGSLQRALVGDRLARLALDHGWQGILVHGAVRDRAALAALDIAVFARGTVPQRGAGDGTGESSVRLEFGGTYVAEGDACCMDGDGVVFISPAA